VDTGAVRVATLRVLTVFLVVLRAAFLAIYTNISYFWGSSQTLSAKGGLMSTSKKRPPMLWWSFEWKLFGWSPGVCEN